MKKSVILLTLLLVGSIAGTYAVYEFYVKQRMRELGEHLEEEKRFRERIAELEETFYRTKPETVLSAWRSEIQPWADAVERRAEFYNLGGIPLRVEIPEEERDLAKWYYKEVQPKMVRALETKAWESRVNIPDITFGTPAPSSYGQGADPRPMEISQHLARIEFGGAIVELLIDAGIKNVHAIEIWPERVEISGRSGDVKSRTTGLSFSIPMADFVRFMDKLSQKDRYFEVKTLQLANSNLLDSNASLDVQMVLAQAYYAPTERATEVGGEAVMSEDTQSLMAQIFGSNARSGTKRTTSGRNEKTWWQIFRQKYLPF